MIGAALIVAGIAIVDSLNPGTIGPALVLAASAHPVRSILAFAAGFLIVNVAAGILVALGPGHWLFSLLPDPSEGLKHWGAVVVGVVLLAGALLLTRRKPKADPGVPARRRAGSAPLFGAGLAVVELPTAFPYFAALAAINAANLSIAAGAIFVRLLHPLFLLPVF